MVTERIDSPVNCATLGAVRLVKEYGFHAWTPLPDGEGKCTQVHMVIKHEGHVLPTVLRIKSAKAAKVFHDTFLEMAAEVWPDEFFVGGDVKA
jgi:hypothetical protein